MGRKITAVVKLLRTQKEEDIIRILNQQSEPTIFLTQLQSESEIRLVHTITQVTAPLGDRQLSLEGKLVALQQLPRIYYTYSHESTGKYLQVDKSVPTKTGTTRVE